MSDSVLQQQLDEVGALLARARALFGPNAVAPPVEISPGIAIGESDHD